MPHCQQKNKHADEESVNESLFHDMSPDKTTPSSSLYLVIASGRSVNREVQDDNNGNDDDDDNESLLNTEDEASCLSSPPRRLYINIAAAATAAAAAADVDEVIDSLSNDL